MGLLHRSKRRNHTTGWVTDYFDLGLVDLKFTMGLGSLTDQHTLIFWDLNPDGVGSKQWSETKGH